MGILLVIDETGTNVNVKNEFYHVTRRVDCVLEACAVTAANTDIAATSIDSRLVPAAATTSFWMGQVEDARSQQTGAYGVRSSNNITPTVDFEVRLQFSLEFVISKYGLVLGCLIEAAFGRPHEDGVSIFSTCYLTFGTQESSPYSLPLKRLLGLARLAEPLTKMVSGASTTSALLDSTYTSLPSAPSSPRITRI
ncbi:hypothetical protein Y032_0703g1666 [Ancylostoma ceylanicum]|uniref:Uncharacterized protein n=1 Tax=Ancylostoma ceylanicum TaxID=53326 RepID=A0A016WH97_9BILA|nr:hypothetical protein Y032_0703g1666 [Ancylostoma ceylanicum]